jgi:two-component system response regulator ResD
LKVLVVEDEEDIRSVLMRMAEFEGYEVKGAADGAEAIRLIDAEAFDLILLDLALPEADGATVAKHLRRVEAVKNRPPAYVLGNTGYVEYVVARGTFERAGINELKEKPLNPAEVTGLMRRLAGD